MLQYLIYKICAILRCLMQQISSIQAEFYVHKKVNLIDFLTSYNIMPKLIFYKQIKYPIFGCLSGSYFSTS